jgi:gluconolactonase
VSSDIPNDRLLRWDETTDRWASSGPAGHPNGNTLDAEGRLVTCEQGNRRVTRTEHDGSIPVIADRFEGLRFGGACNVYRADPRSGEVRLVDDDLRRHPLAVRDDGATVW